MSYDAGDAEGLSLDEKQLDKISKDPRFQEGVADFIKENDDSNIIDLTKYLDIKNLN